MDAPPSAHDLVDYSATLGLIAMWILAPNLIFGILLSTRYKTTALFRRLPARLRSLDLLKIHNWLAFAGLGVALLHPVPLLLAKSERFRAADLLLPVNAPHEKWLYLLGSAALYGLLVVVITSKGWVRRRLSFRTWKAIHYLSYATVPLFLLHGLLVDPNLKDAPVDWLDGEKVQSELLLLVFAAAGLWRLRWAKKQARLAVVASQDRK